MTRALDAFLLGTNEMKSIWTSWTDSRLTNL